MQVDKKTLIIFLRDDGYSLQYPDGQCAGYRSDGIRQISTEQCNLLFPDKIILKDQRRLNITHKGSNNES